MSCYLEDYRARVGTCAGRFSCCGLPRRGDANRTTGGCLELTVLCSMVLAVLLMIGGTEHSPGPVVEVENTVLGAAGIQCELCGRWYQFDVVCTVHHIAMCI